LYDKQILSSEGIVTFTGSVEIDATTACSGTSADDKVTFTVLDTGIYRESNYKTQGFSAFKYGMENPVDDSNVGAGDSADAYLYFD